jgi:hypothetical protein
MKPSRLNTTTWHQFKRLACLSSICLLLSSCATPFEKGVTPFTGYLQLLHSNELIWEHAMTSGNLHCEAQAAYNLRDYQTAVPGEHHYQYRCRYEATPALQLPHSYVSVSVMSNHDGVNVSAVTTTRFNSAAACWEAVDNILLLERKLITESCGKRPPQVTESQLPPLMFIRVQNSPLRQR